MTKTFLAFATLAAIAQPALAETFTRDGVTYNYTVEQRGKTQIISGKNLETREPFELRVSGSRINGTVSGRPVSFSMRDVEETRTSAQLDVIASR